MKKKCALVFGITDTYTFALANVLIGINKHCKVFWDDIIVYHTDVSQEHQDVINSIMQCNFVYFNHDEWSNKVMESVPENRYTIAAFFRYDCFSLLNDYEKVLWSDVDILVQADFSSVLQYGDKSGYACTMTTMFLIEANFSNLIEGYDMFAPIRNSGFILFSDKLLSYGNLMDWCFEKTIQYAKDLVWPDQGILCLMMEEFGIVPEEIDIVKFHCHPWWPQALDPSRASIIHAFGPEKFWNCEAMSRILPEWSVNNDIYNSYLRDGSLISNFTQDNADNPLISVVMSVYDRARYLDEAVQSILNQTIRNFELIVVIEFSDIQDKIEASLSDYNDRRIVVIKNKEKLGFPASLNVGIDNARGTFIARMDDDDISLPTRFEKQLNLFADNPDISVCSTCVESFGSETIRYESPYVDPDTLKIRLLFGCAIWHPSVMMRKADLDKYRLRYEIGAVPEDFELWSRAVKYVKFATIPDILVKWRCTSENETRKNPITLHNNDLSIIKAQFKRYLDLDLSNDELNLICSRVDIISSVAPRHHGAALQIQRELKNRILEANKVSGFYNQEKLGEHLGMLPSVKPGVIKKSFKGVMKRKIKNIFSPIYKKVVNRVISDFDRSVISSIRGEMYNLKNENQDFIEGINEFLNLIKDEINNYYENLFRVKDEINNYSHNMKDEVIRSIDNYYENLFRVKDEINNYSHNMKDEVIRSIDNYYENLFRVKDEINNYSYLMKDEVIRIVEDDLRKIMYQQLIKVSGIDKNEKKIFIFGSPNHANLGDQAQTYCLKEWCKENYPSYEVYDFQSTYSLDYNYYPTLLAIRDKLSEDDKIFIHSGYHTTDVYYNEQVLTTAAIRVFSDNKIIIFPQTVYFNDKEKMKYVADIHNTHNNIVFMCRESFSYEYARKLFLNATLLKFPDIVTNLIGNYNIPKDLPRDGVLFCLRKCYPNEKEHFSDEILYDFIECISKEYANVDVTDTTLEVTGLEIESNREWFLTDSIAKYSKYKVLVTNRYHGVILSLIANTPVIVLKSGVHNLAAGIEWFVNIEEFAGYIYYCERLEDISAVIEKIYSMELDYSLPPYFKENYYDKLKDIIEA